MPVPMKKMRCRPGHQGFTLLELLVAMLMVSMITVIISVAFRLGINSWDRAQREGDSFQARTVIPSLLKKQFAAMTREKQFAAGQGAVKLPFIGTRNSVSFFTTYTAMSGSQKGLLRVTYQYDQDNRTLTFFQQLVLTLDDLQDTHLPLSEQWDGELVPSGSIQGVTHFQVRYSQKPPGDWDDPETMATGWLVKKPEEYPTAIRVEFNVGNEPGPADNLMTAPVPEVWNFTPGI
jgi:prepilin-type N-terminal cleavage/methylation domain-containing protein